MKIKNLLLVPGIILCMLFPQKSFSQIDISLIQPPPGQLNIEDLWKIQINSFHEADVPVILKFTVEEYEQGVLLEGQSRTFMLEALFSGYIGIENLKPLEISQANEEYQNIIMETGAAPAGTYSICLYLIHAEEGTELCQYCTDHVVDPPGPPQLIYPSEGQMVEENLPVFSWMPPMPISINTDISYRFMVFEIHPDEGALLAVEANPPWYIQEGIFGNEFIYPISAEAFENGKKYSWQIIAFVDERELNRSEIGTFLFMGNPQDELMEIELICPENGDIVDPDEVQFCWKKLPIDDVEYRILYTQRKCDTAAMEAPENHPFPYVLPNPRARQLRDSINWYKRMDSLYWVRLCENMDKNLQKAIRNIDHLATDKEKLEKWAAELECELPDHVCNMEPCCEGDCCDDLDPSSEADRKEFQRRLACITGRFNTLHSSMQDFLKEFGFYFNHWNEHRGHREFMQSYDNILGGFEYFYSLEWIDDLSNAVFDALGINQLFDELRSTITSAACQMAGLSPAECQEVLSQLRELAEIFQKVKDGKENIEMARDALRALQSGGKMPIEVLFKLNQALFGAAHEATQSAVKGWEENRLHMCMLLARAYQANACLEQINDELKNISENCLDFCKEAHQAVRQRMLDQQEELDRIRDERIQEWKQDSTDFHNDLDRAIAENVNQILRDCCRGSNKVMEFSFPPYDSDDACKQKLYALLGKYLGNRMCYMGISISVDCKTDSVKFSWIPNDAFERNPDCCPPEESEEEIGRTEGGDQEGGEICLPGEEDEGEGIGGAIRPGRTGRWRVEGSRAGRTVGRSRTREIETVPGRVHPPDDPVKRPPAKKCQCKISLNVNNGPIPFGVKLMLNTNTILPISVKGSCSGSCTGTQTTIIVEPPGVKLLGMNIPMPAARINNTQANYLFSNPGIYKITGEQTCSDGTKCTAVSLVEVGQKQTPTIKDLVPVDLSKSLLSYDQCGNANCIHPYFSDQGNRIFINNNRLEIGSPGVLVIGFTSDCLPNCNKDRDITYLITDPDGIKESFQGMNLYETKYDFHKVGVYHICIIETADCSGIKRSASKYLFILTK